MYILVEEGQDYLSTDEQFSLVMNKREWISLGDIINIYPKRRPSDLPVRRKVEVDSSIKFKDHTSMVIIIPNSN